MRVHVVGLGLIGFSLAWSLTLAGHDVTGWDIAVATRARVRARDLFAIRRSPARPEVVVLATPPKGVLEWVGEIPRGATGMDVASVKAPILARADELKIPFVGGHPLAGSERGGMNDATPVLFRGQPFFLVPGSYATSRDLERAEAVVAATEGVPAVVDACTHDRALALTSHLVWVISRALGDEAGGVAELFREGPAFREVSRAGRSPEALWNEILDLNGRAVEEAWQAVRRRVEGRIGVG